MRALVLGGGVYSALATLVLLVHALFILWVIFGAVVARSHRLLRRLHIACLVWGVLTEVLPWPCPLTLLENWLGEKAGVAPYQGGFVYHYLDKFVYPGISGNLLIAGAVIVCLLNLAYYAGFYWRRGRERGAHK